MKRKLFVVLVLMLVLSGCDIQSSGLNVEKRNIENDFDFAGLSSAGFEAESNELYYSGYADSENAAVFFLFYAEEETELPAAGIYYPLDTFDTTWEAWNVSCSILLRDDWINLVAVEGSIKVSDDGTVTLQDVLFEKYKQESDGSYNYLENDVIYNGSFKIEL